MEIQSRPNYLANDFVDFAKTAGMHVYCKPALFSSDASKAIHDKVRFLKRKVYDQRSEQTNTNSPSESATA
tara:strand:- start:466 stop:678 length:213 start_codon:yes stop_codon:yes gene_type:complete